MPPRPKLAVALVPYMRYAVAISTPPLASSRISKSLASTARAVGTPLLHATYEVSAAAALVDAARARVLHAPAAVSPNPASTTSFPALGAHDAYSCALRASAKSFPTDRSYRSPMASATVRFVHGTSPNPRFFSSHADGSGAADARVKELICAVRKGEIGDTDIMLLLNILIDKADGIASLKENCEFRKKLIDALAPIELDEEDVDMILEIALAKAENLGLLDPKYEIAFIQVADIVWTKEEFLMAIKALGLKIENFAEGDVHAQQLEAIAHRLDGLIATLDELYKIIEAKDKVDAEKAAEEKELKIKASTLRVRLKVSFKKHIASILGQFISIKDLLIHVKALLIYVKDFIISFF